MRALVDSHPDPYAGFGGVIGFWRRVAETRDALPDGGANGAGFLSLLRPLVAGVRDAHTTILPAGRAYDAEPAASLGLEWDVDADGLHVAAAYEEENRGCWVRGSAR